MSGILKNLEWPDGMSNPAGIATKAYYIRKTDIKKFPTKKENPTTPKEVVTYVGNFELKSGATAITLYSTQGKGQVDFEITGEKDCKAVTNKATLSYPDMNDEGVALGDMFGIRPAQAYRDIFECETFLAAIKTSSREYLRYMITEKQKKAINMAEDNNDPDGMSKAANVLGKYNLLDKEIKPELPYEDIVPQPVEFVNDPTLLGMPDIADKKAFVEKVRNKYLYQDVEIIEETK